MRAGRQRMKHRALCVLVFPVECFVDKKEVIFVLRFTFQDLLKLCFEDIRSLQYSKWLKAAKKIKHGATICCFISLMIPTWCLFLFFSEVFIEIHFSTVPSSHKIPTLRLILFSMALCLVCCLSYLHPSQNLKPPQIKFQPVGDAVCSCDM